MLIPNTQRVIIKPIPIDQLKSSGLVIAGQLMAGENLLYGKIIHPGDTQFSIDQGIFYSEYSAATLIDARALLGGKKTYADIKNEGFIVVAQDDIMAYYDDSGEVSKTTKKN